MHEQNSKLHSKKEKKMTLILIIYVIFFRHVTGFKFSESNIKITYDYSNVGVFKCTKCIKNNSFL